MRFLLGILSIAILSAIAEFLLPWWSVAAIAFLISLTQNQKGGRAFLMGFLGVGLCWLSVALYRDIANEHILSTRMAALFTLPGKGMFIIITVIVGALVGGLSSWAGVLIKIKKQ